MKHKLSQLKQHPSYDKAMHWGKLISITGGAQVIVQAVGFLSGVLIIRLLPTQEYALYTLANTMLGTMSVLSDGGISTGVMAQGGKVWQDRERLGAVLATGLDLRRKFAIGSLIASAPILIYLLLHNDASWLTAIMIVLSLIPAFFAALSDSLLEIVPKLHQSILPLQKNMVSVGVGRLVLTALTVFIFPFTFIAILGSGLPRLYGNIKLKKIANNFIDYNQKPDPLVRKEILKVVKRVLPGAIYYSLSGQITIWLISIVGNSTSVAQLGAIGRLAMLLSLISVVFSTLIIPRFARLKNDSALLMNRFLSTLGFLVLVCVFVIAFFMAFSTQALWVLGNNYSKLETELVLYIIGSCIGLLTGFIFSLSSSRGWILNPYLYIVASIISIVIGIFAFNVSTLVGILLFNIFINSIQTTLYLFYTLIKIRKNKAL
ncbi:polysaccharide biosynthesis protein [Flavobacterium urumqiense]|uniref:Membrane protein involved in the export of O-antigen and teichoic acid n=1 Tax=Flavobacterium urumqiense TaxID=935224 RepID=A0A1H5Y567_9FLAO|nr:polysaccharide biosynthesis protein [Flavobacterium urumqiense]SEG18740.1 Membrane protein involved in the export of O-antigen and teichoic acid [Flavobacterium urumqiense]